MCFHNHTQFALTFHPLEVPTYRKKGSNFVNFLLLLSSSIRFLVVTVIMYGLLTPSVFLPPSISLISFFFWLGFRVFSDCTDSQQTICVKCNRDEYQPGWTEKTRCLQQKFCDPGQYLQLGFQNPEKPLKRFCFNYKKYV